MCPIYSNSHWISSMKKFSTFASIGVLNSLLSYCIFSLLYYFGLYYLLASAISFLAGTLFSYTLNAHFTFKKEKNLKAGSLFILMNLFSLCLGLGLLYVFTEFFNIDPFIGQIMVIALRFPLNFLLSSKLIFKK